MDDEEKKKKEEEDKKKEEEEKNQIAGSAPINLLNVSYFGSYDKFEGVTVDMNIWSELNNENSYHTKDMKNLI